MCQIRGIATVAPRSVCGASSPAHTSAGSSSSRAAGGRDGMSARACARAQRWRGRSCTRRVSGAARRAAPPTVTDTVQLSCLWWDDMADTCQAALRFSKCLQPSSSPSGPAQPWKQGKRTVEQLAQRGAGRLRYTQTLQPAGVHCCRVKHFSLRESAVCLSTEHWPADLRAGFQLFLARHWH